MAFAHLPKTTQEKEEEKSARVARGHDQANQKIYTYEERMGEREREREREAVKLPQVTEVASVYGNLI